MFLKMPGYIPLNLLTPVETTHPSPQILTEFRDAFNNIVIVET